MSRSMNSVAKRVVVFFVLLQSGLVHCAEQETKQPSRSDKRTYQPLESCSIDVDSAKESTSIEFAMLQGQNFCAEHQAREQRGLPAMQPILDGHYVSQAALLAGGIEKQIKTTFEQHSQEIETLKQENERALRREKRRACRASCPVFTCSGLTMILLTVGLQQGAEWSSENNKCH